MKNAPFLFSLTAVTALLIAGLIHQLTASAVGTAISLSALDTAYTQDFDTLANAGTSAALPVGWAFSESGSNANALYNSGTGSSSSGDTYSFGAAGSSERALGGLQSSSLITTFGACFQNDTSATITKLTITYNGEMWRLGATTGRLDRLDFQISTDATSLTTGTWTDVDALDFTTPNTTAPTGAKNGNDVSNRTAISADLTGISLAPGAMFFLRWTDFNASGSDDGLAIDDFSLTPAALPTLTISDAAVLEGNSGTLNAVFDVTLSEFFSHIVTVDYTTANGLATAGSDYTLTSGTLTFAPAEGNKIKQIVVPVSGDCLIEDNETFTVSLTNVLNAALLKATGTGTIQNDDLPGTVQFSSANFQLSENGGTALITVTRGSGLGDSISVNYATSDGTAGETADYQAAGGTLIFGCHETSKTFTVTSNDDLLDENEETIILTLSAPANGAMLGAQFQATLTINDDDGPPGILHPAEAEVGDQKAGSILFFPFYISSVANSARENTRFNLTNTDISRAAYVHLFFIENGGTVADSYICLTPGQTTSFLASDVDPGESGFMVAVAVDGTTGCPVSFNFLVGDEYVRMQSGHAANLSAQAVAALPTANFACAASAITTELKFDGINYNALPRVLALDNIPSPTDGNATLLILNRVGGDLSDQVTSIGSFFGVAFDDQENPYSFDGSGGAHLRRMLSNDFPRTTPRINTIIPTGHSGWMKLWPISDRGLIGAMINFNPAAGSNPTAYHQGHNLHTLTLTAKTTYTMPVFPPGCG